MAELAQTGARIGLPVKFAIWRCIVRFFWLQPCRDRAFRADVGVTKVVVVAVIVVVVVVVVYSAGSNNNASCVCGQPARIHKLGQHRSPAGIMGSASPYVWKDRGQTWTSCARPGIFRLAPSPPSGSYY